MKPGGPTERKIGETLANQGNSTVNPLATKVSNPKPKPTKIDPLTGLPKVKVPKLKKPTNAMWEQAANQQKPETSSGLNQPNCNLFLMKRMLRMPVLWMVC